MRKLRLFILSLVVFMGINLWNTFAIDIQVPSSQWNEDIIVTWPSQVHTDEGTIFEMIQIINQYLWFSIWLICMIILIIGGFNLITAEWDAGKTKKANGMLSWSVIWILICTFSYAAVRIVVNLFG